MIGENENKKISKFLSLVLRHQPDLIGLELDDNGWASVDQLIAGSVRAGVSFDLETLKHVVETNAKKRFSFNESLNRIRASQGHSVEVSLGYDPAIPPDVLYHGTAVQHLDAILVSGLEKGQRHDVHLSASLETAVSVGQRHGRVVVLKVDAAQMQADGFIFFVSENGVWLTDHVPVKYLEQ